MAHPPRRQKWSLFVLGVGLVLLLLCVFEMSAVALALGMVLVLTGLVGALLGA